MTDRPGLSRRSMLLSGAALTIASPFVQRTTARAQNREIVVASWGGSRTTAMREVMFAPFEKATGIRVRDDGPPEAAKVKAMVETGNVTWDILDTDIPAILSMVNAKLLDPIDYAKIDKAKLAKIPSVLHHPHGLGHLIYSFNIVYNTRPSERHATQNLGRGLGRLRFKVRAPSVPRRPRRNSNSPRSPMASASTGLSARHRALMGLDGQAQTARHQVVRQSRRGDSAALDRRDDICCTIGPRGLVAKKEGAPIDVESAGGSLLPTTGRSSRVHAQRGDHQFPTS